MEELPILDCRLDPDGMREQSNRYRRLGFAAEAIEAGDSHLEVRFGSDLDRELLDEAIAVENGCCPFFRFDYRPADRLLRIEVERADQAPALDALAYALGESRRAAQASA